MAGCEKIGYMVTINTEQIKYDNLQKIGRMLEEKEFKKEVEERKASLSKYSDEVCIIFQKKVSSKPYHLVNIDLTYVKDKPNNIARNVKVDVHNIYKGMTVTELRDEIDRIGNLIYRELIDRVGEKNVTIESKEIQGRTIFF
jgi:hypothetical protein